MGCFYKVAKKKHKMRWILRCKSDGVDGVDEAREADDIADIRWV